MNTTDLAHRLYYRQPAEHWVEALPIGSGRLGAMIWGEPHLEHIPLNEDTLWSGYPRETDPAVDAEQLAECRRLVANHQFPSAQEQIEAHMLGSFTDSYMPAGDLRLEFFDLEDISEYQRELDLHTASARVSFTSGRTRFIREYFASYPDQGIIIRLTADRPGKIHLRLSFDAPIRHQVHTEKGRLVADLRCPAHVEPSYIHDAEEPILWEGPEGHLGMRARLIAVPRCIGGILTEDTDSIQIEGADTVTLLIALRTSWNGPFKDPETEGADEKALCEQDIEGLLRYPSAELFKRHLAEYVPYYSRTALNLSAEAEDMPTDERLRRFAKTQDDPVLYALLFHYGRYLLIASSRPGTQAANLQGIWSHLLRPVWSSNYTININTQMNYWPAEPCNLSELAAPLFSLIRLLLQKGAHTAQVLYHARGSVSHHNTDLWGLTNPVGEGRKGFSGCAFWSMSFGWLSRHLWDHYLYTDDVCFLEKEALPVLRAASLFYLDQVVLNEEGRYILSPATSPENVFLYEGQTCKVAREAAMSQSILREVWEHYLQALDVLEQSEPEADEIRQRLPLVQRERMGRHGQLLEWEEEYEEKDPHHRHISHLYGLYPGHQITPDTTPALAQACRRTLEIRGDEGTGWSLGWKINLWARLHDGDHALSLLKQQLRLVPAGEEVHLTGGGTYPNLFDAHPPFQIDGNFGACAGIAELLLQTREREIHLLPALPTAHSWQNGSIIGLRAPHGITLDLFWRAGALHHAVLHVDHALSFPITLFAKERSWEAHFDQPGSYVLYEDRLILRGAPSES